MVAPEQHKLAIVHHLNGVIDIIGIETTPVRIDMINVLLTHVLIHCSYDCKLTHSVGVEDGSGKKRVKIDGQQQPYS